MGVAPLAMPAPMETRLEVRTRAGFSAAAWPRFAPWPIGQGRAQPLVLAAAQGGQENVPDILFSVGNGFSSGILATQGG